MQTGSTRAATIADARMLSGDRQDSVTLGMTHGVSDASKAKNDNLDSLAAEALRFFVAHKVALTHSLSSAGKQARGGTRARTDRRSCCAALSLSSHSVDFG